MHARRRRSIACCARSRPAPGAGATQPHLHLQFFQRPGYAFPLEEAAACTDPSSRSQGTPVAAHHPVLAMYFQGSRETVVTSATRWVTRWLDEHKRIGPTPAANIIATCDDETGECNLFLVPRFKLFERVPMLSGRAASLEVLGELVLSSTQERDLLHSGQLSYEKAWGILATLATPGLFRSSAGSIGHWGLTKLPRADAAYAGCRLGPARTMAAATALRVRRRYVPARAPGGAPIGEQASWLSPEDFP
jgi:hypothetical protein